MKKLTKKQIKKYLECPNECPICDHFIKVTHPFDEESGSQTVYCSCCEKHFYEIYKLVSIEIA